MMLNRILPLVAVLSLAVVLWVVPSIGSQGMGTIGEHFVHADRSLLEAGEPAADVRARLNAADRHVEDILAR